MKSPLQITNAKFILIHFYPLIKKAATFSADDTTSDLHTKYLSIVWKLNATGRSDCLVRSFSPYFSSTEGGFFFFIFFYSFFLSWKHILPSPQPTENQFKDMFSIKLHKTDHYDFRSSDHLHGTTIQEIRLRSEINFQLLNWIL